jgi:hypothetical protein
VARGGDGHISNLAANCLYLPDARESSIVALAWCFWNAPLTGVPYPFLGVRLRRSWVASLRPWFQVQFSVAASSCAEWP